MSNSLKIWLLILALVLMGVNAGFYIYSSNLLDNLSSQLDEEPSEQELAKVTQTAHTLEGSTPALEHATQVAKKKDESKEESEAKAEHTHQGEAAEQEEEAEKGEIKSKYRPKLIGQCKNLYEKYVREGDSVGNHRAFSYSFDGQAGNCAIVAEQKSKKMAEMQALKACEKSKVEANIYAPCFVIASF